MRSISAIIRRAFSSKTESRLPVMTNAILEGERSKVFASEDRELYLHVGYFFTWYNNVEWKITTLMAIIMGEKDFSAFDLISSGLDGETKVRRLKRLCNLKKRQIEKPFLDRLEHYADKICTIRNRLAHRALARDERISRFHYMTLDRLPWKALGLVAPKGQQSADHIDALALFEHGHWLNYFSDDLDKAIIRAIERRSLGIGSPRSPLPEGHLSNIPVQPPSPTLVTHAQTAPETQA